MASFDNPQSDPYADAPYNSGAGPDRNVSSVAHRGRSRSGSPAPRNRSPQGRKRSPPPRPRNIPSAKPSAVLGVFGLSIRTQERDLDEEFSRHGRVEKVTIVYDQRSDRSRGFGFIKMSCVEEAARCIQELNGLELNGRRIRVDYSTTDRPHAPTPGEYMGHRRPEYEERRRHDRDSGRERDRDGHRERDWRDRESGRDHRDRDRDREHRDRNREHRDRDQERDRDRERDREHNREHRERDRNRGRRSPSPPRRRRSHSPTSPRGAGSSPTHREEAPLVRREAEGRNW